MHASPIATPAAAVPAPGRRAPGRLGVARFWIGRYLAQDLIAKSAALAWAAAVLPDAPDGAAAAGSCAAVEIAAFYLVVWLRSCRGHGWRPHAQLALCAAIAREYGPAELVDFALRPAAMAFGFAIGADAVGAVLLGSALADVAFYGTAMLACRRAVLTARSEAS